MQDFIKELSIISEKVINRINNCKKMTILSRSYIVDNALELEFFSQRCEVRLNGVKIYLLNGEDNVSDNEIYALEKKTYDLIYNALNVKRESLRLNALNEL